MATYTYRNGERVNSEEKNEQGYINKLLDSYSLVLTDFTNIAETRASIDTLTKILQKQILPIVQPKNTVEVSPMYELAPSFLLSRKTEYTGGKAGIAPFALNSTNHALTLFTHLCINYSNANRYNLGQLDQIYGEDNQRIMDWLSALINAHVDVAKDPYIMTLNVNSVTYNMTSLLIRGGKGENTFYFLAQPALRRFAKEMLESKGIIGAEKGITERSKINSLIKEYMLSLGNAIILLEDDNADKTKYAQYYNSLASRYGLQPIEGYTAIDINYNDVFDKEVMIAALKNPNAANGLYQQVISLMAYQDLSSDTNLLSNLVQLSQIDTKKFGNTLPLQLNFKRRLNRYIENYQNVFYINGAENIEKPLNYYLASTFLKLKLNGGINTPRILLSGQIIEATKGYKTIFNAACDFFLGNSSDKNAVTELSKVLTTSLRTKAVVNAVEDFNISDKKFINMLKGPKSIAKQLTYIKNNLRSRNDLPAIAFNGHIKNELLNYLQEYASDGTNQKYDRIVTADNALTNTATYENRLLSAYQDLLDCEDANIRKFANRLGVYAYLTSFDNRGTDSFFDVITTAWKKQKGYTEAIRTAIEILNTDKLVGMDYFGFNAENIQNNNYIELFTEIARNAYRNDKIVNPYQLNKYDNKYGTLIQLRPETKPMPSVFSSWRVNKPFVKIQINPNDINSYVLYQKVATIYQTDENGDLIRNTSQSVYKVVPVLGTKDDKKVYYEYQKQSGEQSAFEENAIPKEAIWSNEKIKQLVLKFFEPATKKNHTNLVFELTDAIVINAVESLEIVNFELPENTVMGSDLEASNEIHNTENTLSITYGEVDEQISTITVGQDDSITLSDMQVDMEDGTQTIVSDDVLNFTEITDVTFGESPYFDTILNSGITLYEQVQDIIADTNTESNTIQDMRFNDEAYKNCKGK